jgi:proton glutamate symport protein
MKARFLITTLALFFFYGTLGLCSSFGWIHVSPGLFRIIRWLVLLVLAGSAAERRSATAWIFIAMFAGAEFGHDWPGAAISLQILGTIFLRLIKVIIAPLLFATLVVGIATQSDLKKLGKMSIQALTYFEIVSTLAFLIGFAAINLTSVGVGVRLPAPAVQESFNTSTHSASDLIVNIFPENIARSVAEGQTLQVVVFAILFGIALAMVPEPKRRPLIAFAESLSETMFKFTKIVMVVAPLGIFGAISYTIGSMGIGVLLPLLKLLATMYGALIVFVLLILLPIVLFVRVPFMPFLKAVAEPVTIAFGTASSEAALPQAMEEMVALGVARETVAFVLPTGYSFNLDGSSLYQSLALIFTAQVAGIHLSFAQQGLMLLTLLVSSKGIAGVARGSLVVVLTVAASFRLPPEPIFLLLGIDQLMDMARTGVNVLGNCVATLVIARWNGETRPFVRKMPTH